MSQPLTRGRGFVYVIDACLEDFPIKYLVPTQAFIQNTCDVFELKEQTMNAAVAQMVDLDAPKNSSRLFEKLFQKWETYKLNDSAVLGADATVCLSLSDWDAVYGRED